MKTGNNSNVLNKKSFLSVPKDNFLSRASIEKSGKKSMRRTSSHKKESTSAKLIGERKMESKSPFALGKLEKRFSKSETSLVRKKGQGNNFSEQLGWKNSETKKISSPQLIPKKTKDLFPKNAIKNIFEGQFHKAFFKKHASVQFKPLSFLSGMYALVRILENKGNLQANNTVKKGFLQEMMHMRLGDVKALHALLISENCRNLRQTISLISQDPSAPEAEDFAKMTLYADELEVICFAILLKNNFHVSSPQETHQNSQVLSPKDVKEENLEAMRTFSQWVPEYNKAFNKIVPEVEKEKMSQKAFV